MVHDEYLSGQMNRGADGRIRGKGGLQLPPRWGWGGGKDWQLQEPAGWEDPGPAPDPTLSQAQPPNHLPPTSPPPVASSGSSCGSHIQGPPPLGRDKAFCQHPTFHSPSFLTLRMTPFRISAGKVGRTQDVGFSGPNMLSSLLGLGAGPPSSFLFVFLSPQSCEATPEVTPNLQTGKWVQRGHVTSLSTLSPKGLSAWGLSNHSINMP